MPGSGYGAGCGEKRAGFQRTGLHASRILVGIQGCKTVAMRSNHRPLLLDLGEKGVYPSYMLNHIFVAGMVRDQAPAEIEPYVAVAYRNETSGFYNTTPSTEVSETPPHPGFQTPDDGIGAWFWKPELDTVFIDGREWAQADLFTNLSWNDINAVCPEGACAGTLNSYDMTGWTWASVDEIKTLFNKYIGYDALDSETYFYQDFNGEAVREFFKDGWRPTYEGTVVGGTFGTNWRVLLSDIEPQPARTYVGLGLVLLSSDLEVTVGPDGPEAKAGDFRAASFSASNREDLDFSSPDTGVLFFR